MKQNHCSFTIQITQDKQIKCSITTSNSKITTIRLENYKDFYPICIDSTTTELTVCKNSSTAISFMDTWVKNPGSLKKYFITYQNQIHTVLAEELFALVVNAFKTIVEKTFIIDETYVVLPFVYSVLMTRIRNALYMIGLSVVYINRNVNHWLNQQGSLLKIIQEKQNNSSGKKFNVQQYQIIDQIKPNIKRKHNHLKLNQNHLFYASKYFENLNDFIHLTFVSKKYREIMERFTYNPISLNQKTLSFFPNVSEFHLYQSSDKYHPGKKIKKYVNWIPIGWYEMKEKMTIYNYKIDFKKLMYTKKDFTIDVEKKIQLYHDVHNTTNSTDNDFETNPIGIDIVISKGIKEIESRCFMNEKDKSTTWKIKSISIPSTITFIGSEALNNTIDEIIFSDGKPNIQKDFLNIIHQEETEYDNYTKINSIRLPLDGNQMIAGNKIFEYSNKFDQVLYLPESIEQINRIEVEPLLSLTIPSHITALADNCLINCNYLKTIIISDSIQTIPETLFNFIDLEEIVMPNNLTSFNPNWFKQCTSLTKIVLPMTPLDIPQESFEECNYLQEISLYIPPSYYVKGNKIFKDTEQFDQYIYLSESVEIINENQVESLSCLSLPSFVTSLNLNCFNKCFSLRVLELPSTIEFLPENIFSQIPLEQINIPNSLRIFNKHWFDECQTLTSLHLDDNVEINGFSILKRFPRLEQLTISRGWTFGGDRLFRQQNGCLFSMKLPTTIKQINGINVQMEQITNITIPQNITSLAKKCFMNCVQLQHIYGIEFIQNFGKDSLTNCKRLKYNTVLNTNQYSENIEVTDMILEDDENQSEEVNEMNVIKEVEENKEIKKKKVLVYDNSEEIEEELEKESEKELEKDSKIKPKEIKTTQIIQKRIIENNDDNKSNNNQSTENKQKDNKEEDDDDEEEEEIEIKEDEKDDIKLDKYGLTEKERCQLEKWIDAQCGRILFDSNKDNWSVKSPLFNDRLITQKQVLFVIEDTDKEKFGCYMDSQILLQPKTSKSDSKSFTFNLKSNGRLSKMVKMKIKPKNEKEIKLYPPDKPELINLKDIILFKKEYMKNSKTLDRVFFDNNVPIPRAICGKTTKQGFTPKHFIVIQMEMTEEQKFIQKMKRGKKAKERKAILESMISRKEKEISLIQQWTDRKCERLVFDSDVDDWQINSSYFTKMIIGKKHLAFIIETTSGEKIGYYRHNEIEENYSIRLKSDDKAFIFNIDPHKRFKNGIKAEMKCPHVPKEKKQKKQKGKSKQKGTKEKKVKYHKNFLKGGIQLFSKEDSRLIELGDILLYKYEKRFLASYHYTNAFDYKSIKEPLIPHLKQNAPFTISRIIVLEMK